MKRKMMFEEFQREVVSKIKEFLPENFACADVNLQVVKKNNNMELTGLNIRSVENNICPTIYLEQFFNEYQEGAEMEEILSKIAQMRIKHEVTEPFDISQITDFEQVKNKLVPRLINAQMNSELLSTRPHKFVADLAITYCALLDHSFDGAASIAVTNDLLKMWNTSIEKIHEIAIANLAELLPTTFKGMTQVLSEMMEMSRDEIDMIGLSSDNEQMYVLTNSAKVNGATALLDKKAMKDIIEKLGDIYILPSSIHEVIIVPVRAGMDKESLENMVHEVNENEVQMDDRLSNHVYRYNIEKGLYLA